MQVDEGTVFQIPGTFVLFELLSIAEFFTYAKDKGEDALRRDFHIGGEKGMPVEIWKAPAFSIQDVIDRGNHQVEVLLPIDEADTLFRCASIPLPRIHKFRKGADRFSDVLRTVEIEHPEEGFGLIGVGEIGVIKHDEDLEDHAEVGADGEGAAGDGNSIRKNEIHHCKYKGDYDKMISVRNMDLR
jgi:hypothetical protein